MGARAPQRLAGCPTRACCRGLREHGNDHGRRGEQVLDLPSVLVRRRSLGIFALRILAVAADVLVLSRRTLDRGEILSTTTATTLRVGRHPHRLESCQRRHGDAALRQQPPQWLEEQRDDQDGSYEQKHGRSDAPKRRVVPTLGSYRRKFGLRSPMVRHP